MLKKLAIVGALFAAAGAQAVTVAWTDWTASGAPAGTAQGTIAAPSGTVNVGYSGGFSFVQTGCGTAYWDPGTYNGTLNKPPSCDIVALNAGGAKTISFDVPVVDPYMALMSWNGNTVTFSAPFTVVSNGSGYWGSGTPVVNAASDGFVGNGEVHAIIQFTGTFSSIGFTDTTENWHGFTVGVLDRAQDGAVPEPATLALLLPAVGLAAFFGARRRRPARA
jgi:hypothetical protein